MTLEMLDYVEPWNPLSMRRITLLLELSKHQKKHWEYLVKGIYKTIEVKKGLIKIKVIDDEKT